MILEKQTEATILETGDASESIAMSLDLDSAQILMQMLSKNLYSDSIGSTIRECASNALDSHRRAGVNDPIIVSFKANKENNYEFSVEDFGTGLDADDVRNIISKYGKSTKRNSTNELGMMGLGFKAPLAYSSSFYFVCRKDGMERKYMMYEGEDTNTIDLLYEKETEERNGVKVIVPVNYYDRREFYNKISEQLAYFESVYFDVPGEIDNDFQISRSEHFQFSTLASDSKMHICLDNVYYPLESDKLGIDKIIYFPVGLRFSLMDGIFPTPNRESIRYTKEAKDIIIKKITMVADYMVNMYNESIIETDNIIEIMNYYSESSRNLKFASDNYDISDLSKHASVKIAEPKLKGINILNLRLLHKNNNFIFNEYQVKYRIDNGKFRECKNSWNQNLRIIDMTNDRHFLLEDKLSGKKKEYLRETIGKDTGWKKDKFLIKKVKKFNLGKVNASTNYDTYMDILNLRNIQRHLWRAAIKEFQGIVSMYINCIIKIDDIEIPEDWIDSKKKTKIMIFRGTISGPRRIKLAGEIIGKEGKSLERYVDGKNCKWVSTTYKLEEIHQMKHLVIYGGDADVATMDKLFNIVEGNKMKTNIKFIQFSERELKNIEKIDIHNWIKLETFMEGKNKPFKRLVTAYLIHLLIKKNDDVFERRERFKHISNDLYTKLNMLEEYKNKHYCNANENIYNVMLEIANDNNLFDGEMYPIYKEVKAIVEKLTFLQPICDKLSYYSSDKDPLVDVIADLFKYYKTRIDWKNYKIKINQDEVLETVIEN